MLEREERITKERLDEGLGEWAAEAGHLTLDLIGLFPGVGNIADGLNAAWYAQEGRHSLAALSALSAIPGAGYAGAVPTAAKWANKFPKMAKWFKTSKQWAAAKGIGKAGRIAKLERAKTAHQIAQRAAAAKATKLATDAAKAGKSPQSVKAWREASELANAEGAKLLAAREALFAAKGGTRTPGAIAARKAAAKAAAIGAKMKGPARDAADFAIEMQKILGIHKGTWSGKAKQTLARTLFKGVDDTDQEEYEELLSRAAGDPYDPDTQEALMELAEFQNNKPAGPFNAEQLEGRFGNVARELMMNEKGQLVPIEVNNARLAKDLEAIATGKDPKRDNLAILQDILSDELAGDRSEQVKALILKSLGA